MEKVWELLDSYISHSTREQRLDSHLSIPPSHFLYCNISFIKISPPMYSRLSPSMFLLPVRFSKFSINGRPSPVFSSNSNGFHLTSSIENFVVGLFIVGENTGGRPWFRLRISFGFQCQVYGAHFSISRR